MMPPPRLFDPLSLARARRRAAAAPADFLLRHVATDLADRLGAVLREHRVVAEIGAVGRIVEAAVAGLASERYLRVGPAEGDPDIVAEAEALPLAEASIDLALSALALQTVDDLPGALLQIRRALRPDGLFLGAMLGGSTLTELRQAFTLAESEIEGGASPRVIPFVDVREAGALLMRAGFALPVTDSETLTVRYADPFALMADLRAMGATNPLHERRKGFSRRATLLRMAGIYRERFADPDGRIRATFEIVWMSGWAPHESQQKPLRPGSAKARLAEALGAVEHGAGEPPPITPRNGPARRPRAAA